MLIDIIKLHLVDFSIIGVSKLRPGLIYITDFTHAGKAYFFPKCFLCTSRHKLYLSSTDRILKRYFRTLFLNQCK